MTTSELRKNVVSLPDHPGIYIFKDKKDKHLYIGKALNLKNRIKNYAKTEDVRLQRMISEAKKLSFVITDSDIEALLLESQYIKKYNPPFNIMLRDDKQYFFVGFTQESFPKIFLTHQPQKGVSSDSYIGPFTDGAALKTTLRLLRKIFPYCTCKQPHNNYCLNYHIGKCLGVCCLKKDAISGKYYVLREYKKNIKAVKDILSGKRKSLIQKFEKEMKKLAQEEKFEKAMELQTKIEKLKRVFQNAQIIHTTKNDKISTDISKQLAKILGLKHNLNRIEAYDIANIQGKHAVGVMVVFDNGALNKNEYRKFKITNISGPNDVAMLSEILTRRFNHPEWQRPDLILIDGGKAQFNIANKIVPKQIPIIAITKNEKHIGEKIIIAGKKNPVPLYRLPIQVKNLILQINSEAHRFAISYYRKLHLGKLKNGG